MNASTQITNTKRFAFITELVVKLLSCKVIFCKVFYSSNAKKVCFSFKNTKTFTKTHK